MNYFTFLILSLWNPGCMLHLKRGDFDEPQLKGHRRLVATLSDSAALESQRKVQWGWWKLKRNIWASVGAARGLIKLICPLSLPTPPQHIINTAAVFCEPLPLPSLLRTGLPIIAAISSFLVSLWVASLGQDKGKMLAIAFLKLLT